MINNKLHLVLYLLLISLTACTDRDVCTPNLSLDNQRVSKGVTIVPNDIVSDPREVLIIDHDGIVQNTGTKRLDYREWNILSQEKFSKGSEVNIKINGELYGTPPEKYSYSTFISSIDEIKSLNNKNGKVETPPKLLALKSQPDNINFFLDNNVKNYSFNKNVKGLNVNKIYFIPKGQYAVEDKVFERADNTICNIEENIIKLPCHVNQGEFIEIYGQIEGVIKASTLKFNNIKQHFYNNKITGQITAAIDEVAIKEFIQNKQFIDQGTGQEYSQVDYVALYNFSINGFVKFMDAKNLKFYFTTDKTANSANKKDKDNDLKYFSAKNGEASFVAPESGYILYKINDHEINNQLNSNPKTGYLHFLYDVENKGLGFPKPAKYFYETVVVPLKQILMSAASKTYLTILIPENGLNVIAIIKLAMTLCGVIYGLFYILGMIQNTKQEFLSIIIKLTIVSILISDASWSFFSRYIFVFFDNIMNFMINAMVGEGMGDYPFAFVDNIIGKYFDPVRFISLTSYIIFFGPSLLTVVITGILIGLMFKILFVILKVVANYCVNMFLVAFLISLSPIFISFILFKYTQQMFTEWWKTAIYLSVQPAITILSIIIILNLIDIMALKNLVSNDICMREFIRFKFEFLDIKIREPLTLFWYTPPFASNNLIEVNLLNPVDGIANGITFFFIGPNAINLVKYYKFILNFLTLWILVKALEKIYLYSFNLAQALMGENRQKTGAIQGAVGQNIDKHKKEIEGYAKQGATMVGGFVKKKLGI